jgi:dynein heavy chain 2
MATQDFKDFVARSLLLFEREVKDLNIQIFTEVLEHISRIDRLLAQPGGNLLLVGKSGVGRRSAVALTTFMYNMRLFTPNMSRGYSAKNFRTDLKTVLNVAGMNIN